MKHIQTRKIVLLAAIGILAAVYVCQLIYSGGSKVKDILLDGEPDAYEIVQNGGTLSVAKDGGQWVAGDKKYPADASVVSEMNETAGSIRVLGTVSRGGDAARYGLDENTAIVVDVRNSGKTLRTIRIGKTSVTAQQTYVQLDGSKEVLLVSGDIGDVFAKTIDEIRDKAVYSVAAGDIVRVDAEKDRAAFSLVKAGDPAAWVRGDIQDPERAAAAVDTEKAAAWIGSLTSLRVQSFADENVMLPAQKAGSVTLTVQNKAVTVTVYPSTEEGSYLCTSSEIPYPFYLSSYAAEKYLKAAGELEK